MVSEDVLSLQPHTALVWGLEERVKGWGLARTRSVRVGHTPFPGPIAEPDSRQVCVSQCWAVATPVPACGAE